MTTLPVVHDAAVLFTELLRYISDNLVASSSSSSSTSASTSALSTSTTSLLSSSSSSSTGSLALDSASIGAIFGSNDARTNISSDFIYTLSPSLRQAIWKIVPTRCDSDLLFLLYQIERSVHEIELQFDINDGNRYVPGSPFMTNTKPGRGVEVPGLKRIRMAITKRHKLFGLQTLFNSVKGNNYLYAKVCSLLQNLWETSYDSRWACIRSDIYILHFAAQRSSSTTGTSGSTGGSTGGASASTAVPLPSDPLAPLIFEIQKTINGTGSFESILNVLKPLFVRRGKIDRNILNDKALAMMKTFRSWAVTQKVGVNSGASFDNPVIELVPAIKEKYLELIKRPMDFRTMRIKAERKEYNSLEDISNDMELIVNNCVTYNSEVADISKLARLLQTEFRNRMKKFTDELVKAGVISNNPAVNSEQNDTVALSFEPQSMILQILMVFADPLLIRLAVQAVYHQGLLYTARKGMNMLDPQVSSADTSITSATQALTILALTDLAYAEPNKNVSSSSISTVPTVTEDGVSLYRSEYTPAVYEQLACGVGEIIGILTPSSSIPPIIQFPLALTVACVSLRNIILSTLLLNKVSDNSAAPSLSNTTETKDEGMDLNDNSSITSSDALAFQALYDKGIKALQLLRYGTNIHGRTIGLLSTYTAMQLFSPSDTTSFTKWLDLVYISSYEVPSSSTKKLIFIPQTIVTSRIFLSGIYKRKVPLASSASMASLAGSTNIATGLSPVNASDASMSIENSAVVSGGGTSNASKNEWLSSMIVQLMDKLWLPTLAGGSMYRPLRALLHKQFVDFLRICNESNLLVPTSAVVYLRQGLLTLLPSSKILEQSTTNINPLFNVSSLLSTGHLQPVAVYWLRPDFDSARIAYSSYVALYCANLFDWNSIGIAPYAAIPPVPSSSPSSSTSLAVTGGFTASGGTPGSGGMTSMSYSNLGTTGNATYSDFQHQHPSSGFSPYSQELVTPVADTPLQLSPVVPE